MMLPIYFVTLFNHTVFQDNVIGSLKLSTQLLVAYY